MELLLLRKMPAFPTRKLIPACPSDIEASELTDPRLRRQPAASLPSAKSTSFIGRGRLLKAQASPPHPTPQLVVTAPCLQEDDTRRLLRVVETHGGIPLRAVMLAAKTPAFYQGWCNSLLPRGCSGFALFRECAPEGGEKKVPDPMM